MKNHASSLSSISSYVSLSSLSILFLFFSLLGNGSLMPSLVRASLAHEMQPLSSSCQIGYSLVRGECQLCNPGSYCDNGINSTLCGEGKWSRMGASSCEKCSCRPGFMCNSAASAQYDCQACVLTTKSHYCEDSVAKACPPGHVALSVSKNLTTGACLACECQRGFYCDPLLSSSQPMCQSATPGRYAIDSVIYSCPVGRSASGFGATMCSDCGCPVGQWCSPLGGCSNCTQGGTCFNSIYTACPPGQYGDNRQGCYKCPCANGTLCAYDYHLSKRCVTNECGYGSICVNGMKIPCPAGRYSTPQSMSECLDSNCPDGFYSPQNSLLKCDPCETGSFCVRSIKQPCPNGYYAENRVQADCVKCNASAGHYCLPTRNDRICPMGYFCPGSSLPPIPCNCSAGQWCRATELTQPQCESCPLGYYCMGGPTQPKPCTQPGFWCPLGSATPIQYRCPMGYYCPALQVITYDMDGGAGSSASSTSLYIEPIPCSCESTRYCVEGLSMETCMECPSGMFCAQSIANVCTVASGKYCPTATRIEQGMECPAGFECHGGSTLPRACQKGTFAPAGSSACRDCAPGSYASSNQQASCTLCSIGRFSNLTRYTGIDDDDDNVNDNSTSSNLACRACQPGTYSIKSGGISEKDACYPCPMGSWSDAMASGTCNMCPAGRYGTQTGATSVDRGCETCLVGHFCATGTLEPTPCPAGTYNRYPSMATSSGCLECPGGMMCPEIGMSEPQWCVPGYYCPVRTTQPKPCPTGRYSNTTFTPEDGCLGCDVMMYNPIMGQTVCQQCVANAYTNVQGSTSCMTCEWGTIVVVTPTSSSTSSTASPSSTIDSPTTSTCMKCPTGTYHSFPQATACSDCGLGFYSEQEGSRMCFECEPGTYGNQNNQSECVKCPQHSFTHLRKMTSCESCTLGSFTLSDGSVECIACPKGTMGQRLIGTTKRDGDLTTPQLSSSSASSWQGCIDCPMGYYSDQDRSTYCLPCRLGQFSNATRQSSCEVCPLGHYSESLASTTCSQCPRGRYNPTMGQVSIDGCVLCPHGTYAEHPGASRCTLCPQGTYNPSLGQTSSSNCLACPSKSDCAEGSASPDSYCAPGMILVIVDPRHVSSSNRSCVECEAGYYCPNSREKLDCPMGAFCATKSIQPTRCPLFTYTDPPVRAQYASDCKECQPGYICLNGAQMACPSGTYSSASNQTTCDPCPLGTISPKEGQSMCEICPLQTFSNPERAMECIQCISGSYTNHTQSGSCMWCPFGWYASSSSSSSSSSSFTGTSGCQPCTSDEFCAVGTSSTHRLQASDALFQQYSILRELFFPFAPSSDSSSSSSSSSSSLVIYSTEENVYTRTMDHSLQEMIIEDSQITNTALLHASIALGSILLVSTFLARCCCREQARKMLMTMDLLSLEHYHPPNQALVKTERVEGGYAIWIVILGSLLVFVYNYYQFGSSPDYTNSLVPEPAPFEPNGDWIMTVIFVGAPSDSLVNPEHIVMRGPSDEDIVGNNSLRYGFFDPVNRRHPMFQWECRGCYYTSNKPIDFVFAINHTWATAYLIDLQLPGLTDHSAKKTESNALVKKRFSNTHLETLMIPDHLGQQVFCDNTQDENELLVSYTLTPKWVRKVNGQEYVGVHGRYGSITQGTTCDATSPLHVGLKNNIYHSQAKISISLKPSMETYQYTTSTFTFTLVFLAAIVFIQALYRAVLLVLNVSQWIRSRCCHSKEYHHHPSEQFVNTLKDNDEENNDQRDVQIHHRPYTPYTPWWLCSCCCRCCHCGNRLFQNDALDVPLYEYDEEGQRRHV